MILTGSRAYGIPKADSDIDIVLLVQTPQELAIVAENTTYNWDNLESCSIRKGNLNLILCPNTPKGRLAYQTWIDATNILIARAPVTRDVAVGTMAELRKDRGLSVSCYDH